MASGIYFTIAIPVSWVLMSKKNQMNMVCSTFYSPPQTVNTQTVNTEHWKDLRDQADFIYNMIYNIASFHPSHLLQNSWNYFIE